MKRWLTWSTAALVLASFAGCQAAAAFFRWTAGVAESPEAESAAAGIASAIGLGPVWGWGSAAAAALVAAFTSKKALDGGQVISALTGGLEAAKADRTPAEAVLLRTVFDTINRTATAMGADKKLDAALAARGHNATPVLRAAAGTASTEESGQ